MRCEHVTMEAGQCKFIVRLSFVGGDCDWDRGCDRDRGRGWKGIRLPEGDSGGRRRHKTEPILSLPPTLLAKEGVRGFVGEEGECSLQQGRPLSDLLVVGFGETCKGRSQFELVMGGGVLSLGLAAGGPLQTLNKERGTDKKDSWTMGSLPKIGVFAVCCGARGMLPRV